MPQPHRERHVKIKAIGKGSFGVVWLVLDTVTQEKLVLKEVSLTGLPAKEQRLTANEVKVLRQLAHPNIISYRESFIRDCHLCIVMEWAAGGDLGSLINQRQREGLRFTEGEAMRYMYQIISALAYCHHHLKLLHRDLKPANVFLSASGDVKLGDFGISKLGVRTLDLAETQCGTPLYMSPEQCRGQPYSRAADIWAVGCIGYEMLALRPPWLNLLGPRPALYGLIRVISTQPLDVSGLRRQYSDEACALLAALTARDQTQRPDLLSVLSWPIMKQASSVVAAKEAKAAAKLAKAPAERAKVMTPMPAALAEPSSKAAPVPSGSPIAPKAALLHDRTMEQRPRDGFGGGCGTKNQEKLASETLERPSAPSDACAATRLADASLVERPAAYVYRPSAYQPQQHTAAQLITSTLRRSQAHRVQSAQAAAR